MHHLFNEPHDVRENPTPLDALLPAAVAMSALSLILFAVLFVL